MTHRWFHIPSDVHTNSFVQFSLYFFFHLPLVCRSQQMYRVYATLVYECQGICFTKINSIFFSLPLPILFDYYLRLFSVPVSILSFAHVLLQKQLNLTLSYYNFWLITSFNHSVSFHSHDFLNLFSLPLSFCLWAVVLCTLCNVWHNLHVLQSHGNANCRNGNYCMNFSSKIYDGAPFDQWQI